MLLKPEELAELYREAFQKLDKKRDAPEIEVSFYPYIGINHTIRLRNGRAFVRISEIFENAPRAVQKSLALILVAKLLRKKIPPEVEMIYRQFAKSSEIQSQAFENKRVRGKKIITSSQGDFYDLEEIFDRLNEIYFNNRLPKPVLTWSARKTFRRLGHHDTIHRTIVISKSLDNKKVPKYVVEFVVFHEMLHIHHPAEKQNGRHFFHTPAFRRDEEKFEYFEEAEKWIEQNLRLLKRHARNKGGRKMPQKETKIKQT